MRIIHVIPTYLPATRYGGPVYSVHSLARALVKRGHTVDVFTTNVDGPGLSDVPVSKPVGFDGVNVWYFPVTWPRRSFRAPALRRAISDLLPACDVAHLHSSFLWPTWVAASAAKKLGTPYVLAPRGMLIKDLIDRRSRLAKSVWIRLFERSNVEGAAGIHVTSQLEGEELTRFGWRLPQLFVIPNGIEDPSSGRGEIGADLARVVADKPLILFLGRISWKKGIDRLLRAFSRCHVGQLAIVGPDDEGLAPTLIGLSVELGLESRVHIVPREVVGHEKEALFAAAQLFVLSSYSENFGNTVLEAMRRGVPVVVTPEVGVAELVRASNSGIVVEGEPASLGAAITSLISNSELASSMGSVGQRYATTYYSWSNIAAQTEDMYKSLSRPNA